MADSVKVDGKYYYYLSVTFHKSITCPLPRGREWLSVNIEISSFDVIVKYLGAFSDEKTAKDLLRICDEIITDQYNIQDELNKAKKPEYEYDYDDLMVARAFDIKERPTHVLKITKSRGFIKFYESEKNYKYFMPDVFYVEPMDTNIRKDVYGFVHLPLTVSLCKLIEYFDGDIYFDRIYEEFDIYEPIIYNDHEIFQKVMVNKKTGHRKIIKV